VIRRTLLEWDHLPYGKGEHQIPDEAASRIAAVAARSPLAGRSEGGVLDHGRKALRARGVVGIVAAQGAALEILPKIDLPAEDSDQPVGAIRKKLIHMLCVAHDLRVEAGAATEHDWQKDSLLDVLIRIFSTRLAEAVRRGMPRHYITQAEDLAAIRGRLDVHRQFSKLASTPQRLACRFDELLPDISLNQVMKAAVHRLARAASAADNQRRLGELKLAYAGISDVPVKALRWDNITLDRTNERWRELVELAKLLLGERFQTSSMGESMGFSLLFEMNLLFEAYVARLLARALTGSGLTVSAQGGRLYCLADETGRKLFQTRPDILIRRGGQVIEIVDTKWKRMSGQIDDRKRGVSQADVYQMMAYSRLYACKRVTLLYPHHAKLHQQPGKIARHAILDAEAAEIGLATIDIHQSASAVCDALFCLFNKREIQP
jgi:5-methylcytosine-specific restriction enzyme subunit McrC